MTETENIIAGIVGRALEIEDVEADELLYELGPDSLQIIRIVLEIGRRLSIEIPLEAIDLERETIASLAGWIDAGLPPRPALLRGRLNLDNL